MLNAREMETIEENITKSGLISDLKDLKVDARTSWKAKHYFILQQQCVLLLHRPKCNQHAVLLSPVNIN